MIRPPRGSWLFINLNACCVQRNAPVRFVSTTRFHCSMLRSSIGIAGAVVPALLKRTSRRPNWALTPAKTDCTDARSPTSAGTAIRRRFSCPASDTDSSRPVQPATDDDDVVSLTRQRDRGGPPDPTPSARDHRHLRHEPIIVGNTDSPGAVLGSGVNT